jgi:CelD/BcsL family acetyltransferase involved in cellulose biosynthesis
VADDARSAIVTSLEMEAPAAEIGGSRSEPIIAGVSCSTSLDAVQSDWLRLQATGAATPYQSFDWCRAWCEAMAETGGAGGLEFEPMIVTLRDPRGRALGILPLGVRRRRGLAVASFLGGKHANLAMGLFDPRAAARLAADDLLTALRQAATLLGVDLYRLERQPLAWHGAPNPLALLPRQPSPDSAWRAALARDGEATLKALLSRERRKKLRSKERKLAELGDVEYLEARDPGQAAAILDAFLAQKAERFRRMGIDDPFAGPSIRRFLSRAAAPAGERPPALSLFALAVDGRIASVFGGAGLGPRFSGMFMSYDEDARLARSSPGELLLAHVIRRACARGYPIFDLGAGDAPYKRDYCPEREPLFDSLLPMTAKGRAGAWALSAALTLKRAAKRSELVSAGLARLRRARAR